TVVAFRKTQGNIHCIQAKLNFYNTKQNVLTRLFTAEYSLWFDLILPGLQSIKAPIPLGGTSNHFLTSELKKIGGWDSFNVTEDADLGMRLIKNGLTTAIINSYTLEEANSSVRNWLYQRSRWIKGYIQTYFVHMRDPQNFNRSKSDIFIFQLVIGGKVLSTLINPLMWILTISYFVFRMQIGNLVDSFFIPPIFYMAVISLFFGNFLYTYYYMVSAVKRNQWNIVYYALLTPAYWLLISAAAFYGIYELLYKPHFWHKTKHGLHLQKIPGKQVHISPQISISPAPSISFN
ncbi:MAG TPA: glycosyltransferase family 2 protein, partial [Candidatus Eisenbacteria bacterium]|nr:glycosyltransferase family 2 protein [Candidatus Eisenbacteria bacterium]